MRVVPNMRAMISASQIQLALDHGACVSYFGCNDPAFVYIEGKPDHLKDLERSSRIVFLSDIELIPSKVVLKGSDEYDSIRFGEDL